MADINSKNMYALLGNDPEYDSDREPEPPTKAVDGPAARQGKRNAPKEAPSAPAASGSGRGERRGGGATGNEQAFRDRDAGRNNNRGKPIDDNIREDRHPNQVRGARNQGAYEGRGGRGRGGRGGGGAGRTKDDRHSRTGVADSGKQGDQSWGAPSGDAEWKDERAGAADAVAEEKAAVAEGEWNASAAAGAPGWDEGGAATANDAEVSKENEAEPDPADSHVSYAEYLANKTKDLALGPLEARKPNQGKLDKKFANAKPLEREDEEDSYIQTGEGLKHRRERERKQKELVDINYGWTESAGESGGRGGGRGRGGRGRGEGRGGGERGERGERGGRGGFRGGRGGEDGERGGYRGRGRGGGGDGGEGRGRGGGYRGARGGGGGGGARNDTGPSLNDETAFPSLGGK